METAITFQSVQITPACVIDFESFSECDIKECGATVYSQHPSTEILCMSWRLPTMDKALVWVPGREPFPQQVIDWILSGGMIEAHNAYFEKSIWRYILVPKFDIPWPKKWKDTLAACAYRSLPQGLDEVGSVLDLAVKKDKRGKFLLDKLSKPQKPTKKNPETRCRDPQLLEELYAYCGQDGDAEFKLGHCIGDLPRAEYHIWVLDQRINDRGVYIDQEAVRATLKIVQDIEEKLEKRLAVITNGAVKSGSEVKKMREWLAENGCHMSDLTKDNVAETVKVSPKGSAMREVLEIRQMLSRSSTAKLYKYMSCLAADGRIHGLLQYHGASTGRWAGRLLQPQNFPRGNESILQACYDEVDERGINDIIELLRGGEVELIELILGDPMEVISSILRGFITAAPGKRLYVSDFSAIEARVLAWLFNEEWKIEAFYEIDAGKGYKGSEDMYCAAASMALGHTVTKKNKAERQTGKTMELSFGYQGGVGAWRKFDDSDKWTDEQVDEHKVAWRKAHPNIVAGWYGLEDAAISTVLTGKSHGYAYIRYEIVNDAAGRWLSCILPNGKRLWYYNPQLQPFTDRFGRQKYQLSYEGRDNKRGGMWGIVLAYGGSLTENVVSAISREIMVEAMIRVEQAGYPIILTIHDEIVAETDEDFGSLEEFDRLMKVIPDWLEGCPINTAGWCGFRFHKE